MWQAGKHRCCFFSKNVRVSGTRTDINNSEHLLKGMIDMVKRLREGGEWTHRGRLAEHQRAGDSCGPWDNKQTALLVHWMHTICQRWTRCYTLNRKDIHTCGVNSFADDPVDLASNRFWRERAWRTSSA